MNLQLKMKEITRTAERAAAHAYDAIVNIPVVGPVLAPVAAGVAFAAVEAFGVMSAAGGAWEIDRDRLALVHAHESIIPARQAAGLRDLVENGGGGRDNHFAADFAPTNPGTDARRGERVLTKQRSPRVLR